MTTGPRQCASQASVLPPCTAAASATRPYGAGPPRGHEVMPVVFGGTTSSSGSIRIGVPPDRRGMARVANTWNCPPTSVQRAVPTRAAGSRLRRIGRMTATARPLPSCASASGRTARAGVGSVPWGGRCDGARARRGTARAFRRSVRGHSVRGQSRGVVDAVRRSAGSGVGCGAHSAGRASARAAGTAAVAGAEGPQVRMGRVRFRGPPVLLRRDRPGARRPPIRLRPCRTSPNSGLPRFDSESRQGRIPPAGHAAGLPADKNGGVLPQGALRAPWKSSLAAARALSLKAAGRPRDDRR